MQRANLSARKTRVNGAVPILSAPFDVAAEKALNLDRSSGRSEESLISDGRIIAQGLAMTR